MLYQTKHPVVRLNGGSAMGLHFHRNSHMTQLCQGSSPDKGRCSQATDHQVHKLSMTDYMKHVSRIRLKRSSELMPKRRGPLFLKHLEQNWTLSRMLVQREVEADARIMQMPLPLH